MDFESHLDSHVWCLVEASMVLCAALGAIGIAAVGVYGVLQLSLMVAQGTGRSIMADKQKRDAEQQARRQPPG